ncbi:hypothetical protein HanRHA438_Chr03g0129231 [Helianthus annuus]|nr:hypothetical protein HanRHA438_Chr03g0129231 [Helianthus annuus]
MLNLREYEVKLRQLRTKAPPEASYEGISLYIGERSSSFVTFGATLRRSSARLFSRYCTVISAIENIDNYIGIF